MAHEANTPDFMNRKASMFNMARRCAILAFLATTGLCGPGGFDDSDGAWAQGTGKDDPVGDASVINPQIIQESRTIPEYPPRARTEGVRAKVFLAVTVLRDGSVSNIKIQKVHLILVDGTPRDIDDPAVEDDLGFSAAARAAVAQWRYRPGTRSGEPVDVWIHVVVEFTLEDKSQGARDVYCGVGGVTNPVLIPESKVSPHYPKRARKEHVEARLIGTALIDKDGAVVEFMVLRRTLTFRDGRTENFDVLHPNDEDEYGFDEAARDGVRKWRYEPCRRGGVPLKGWFTVVIDFVLVPDKKEKPVEQAANGLRIDRILAR
jgi:outer membrane biosynthesis protein TonB